MKRCHKCGIELDDACLPCRINNVVGFFCSVVCFELWDKEYNGKYEGGLI